MEVVIRLNSETLGEYHFYLADHNGKIPIRISEKEIDELCENDSIGGC